jgi:putative DNA methylase
MSGGNAKMSFNKALSSLKGFTARQANIILNKKGPFWSPENFDHWCRTPEKEESAKKYIRNNPVKAGLVSNPNDWPWLREK